MNVHDLMSPNVRVIPPDQPVSLARRVMRREGLDALLVVDECQLAGIVTLSDIDREVAAAGADADAVKVEDVMSNEVIVCREHESVERCATRMAFLGVERMPVVGEGGEILGMVTFADVRHAED
jgi:CBS domain-containing protein